LPTPGPTGDHQHLAGEGLLHTLSPSTPPSWWRRAPGRGVAPPRGGWRPRLLPRAEHEVSGPGGLRRCGRSSRCADAPASGGFNQAGCRPPPSPREFQIRGALDQPGPSGTREGAPLSSTRPTGPLDAEQFSRPALSSSALGQAAVGITTSPSSRAVLTRPQADHGRFGPQCPPCGDRIQRCGTRCADVARSGGRGSRPSPCTASFPYSLKMRTAWRCRHHGLCRKTMIFAPTFLIRPRLADTAWPRTGRCPAPLVGVGRARSPRTPDRRTPPTSLLAVDRPMPGSFQNQVFSILLRWVGAEGLRKGGLELLAVLPAVHPGCRSPSPFAGADLGGNDPTTVTVRWPRAWKWQHAEAVLRCGR